MEGEVLYLRCVKFRDQDVSYTLFTEDEFMKWSEIYTDRTRKLYKYWPEIISIYVNGGCKYECSPTKPGKNIGGLLWFIARYYRVEVGILEQIVTKNLMNQFVKKIFAQKTKFTVDDIYNILVLCDDEALRLYAKNSLNIENNIDKVCAQIFHKEEYTGLIDKLVNGMNLSLELVLRKIFGISINSSVIDIISRAEEIKWYVGEKFHASFKWRNLVSQMDKYRS